MSWKHNPFSKVYSVLMLPSVIPLAFFLAYTFKLFFFFWVTPLPTSILKSTQTLIKERSCLGFLLSRAHSSPSPLPWADSLPSSSPSPWSLLFSPALSSVHTFLEGPRFLHSEIPRSHCLGVPPPAFPTPRPSLVQNQKPPLDHTRRSLFLRVLCPIHR